MSRSDPGASNGVSNLQIRHILADVKTFKVAVVPQNVHSNRDENVDLKLFSEKGVAAVSMRTINTEAGTKNKSAVHYHFGNKDGILKAIFKWVGKQVEPAVQDLWVQIEQREDKNEMSIQELMLVLYTPLILVKQIPQRGNDIFKLLSKQMYTEMR